MAAGGRRRRRDVHADDVGLDRAAEDRPARRRPASTRSPIGRPSSSRSSRAPSSPTTPRSTSTCACSTSGPRSSTAAASRSSTRTGPRRARTSPTWSTTTQVNVLQAVPMLYRLLIDVNREDGRTFPSVRHVITTGDKIPAELAGRAARPVPRARFYNVYGCTETNDSLVHEFLGLADGNVPTNIPVGQPIPGVTARVQNEDGTPLEGTGTGELLVWTPFQTRGYLKAALNEGKFVSVDDGRRPYLLQDRRHRPPPRRRDADARGPRRLLRQGPRRARLDAGRRAGDPGAPRGRRGGGHRRARRARRRQAARRRAPRARREAQQPACSASTAPPGWPAPRCRRRFRS